MKAKTNILIGAGLSLIISFIVVIGVYNFMPVGEINEVGGEQLLGATITTIAGSDTLKASRSVINTNFANLNSDKTEISTTTLPLITDLANLDTIGTITTGIWNGTAIPVGYGGTGTTSPTTKQIMIGNGANGLQVIGFGTNGQFLTSGGDATLPSWTTSSIDEAGDYTWTGTHNFNATTTQSGVYGGLTPTGSITAYASSTAPTGWFLADGSAVSRSLYSILFDVIGTTYGVGDGSTTFNIPNLNGRNIIGYGSATTTIDTMGETGGEDEHVQSIAEMPAHTHSNIADEADRSYSFSSGGPSEGDLAGGGTTGSAGSGTAFNVLDPFIVLQYIIKF